MAKGDSFACEAKEVTDDRALRPTVQLTDNDAHNRHIYLYTPCFTDDGGTLIYLSERAGGRPLRRKGAQNIFSMDLSNFRSTQLTDARGIFGGGSWYIEKTRRIYYWEKTALRSVQIDTLEEETIYDEGYQGSYLSASCDGRFVAFGARCEEVPRFDEDFAGHFALMVIATDGSGSHPALTVPFPISHVQFSPVDPTLIIFCWEGPWRSVPQRIWKSNIDGVEAGPLGPQNPNECRGHEFFTGSGSRVGYHGSHFHLCGGDGKYMAEETSWFVGLVNADGARDEQFECPGPTGHCQMNFAEDLFVCDEGCAHERPRQCIALMRIHGQRCVPEPLFYHGSSWKPQGAHPHPQFRPGDAHVIFTTDYTGLSNIYMTTV